MNKILEVQFSGWTATPRMPFVITGGSEGGSICMPTPSYSIIMGIIGCCLGRFVESKEVDVGFKYSYGTVAKDIETRKRYENKGKGIVINPKGTNPYKLEFHTFPQLTIWLNRLDWKEYFENPIGTPSLGRSQDILKIDNIRIVEVQPVKQAKISGCMLPFDSSIKAGGQLIQLAEAFNENVEVGSGRTHTKSKIFISIPADNDVEIAYNQLYQTIDSPVNSFYLHKFHD